VVQPSADESVVTYAKITVPKDHLRTMYLPIQNIRPLLALAESFEAQRTPHRTIPWSRRDIWTLTVYRENEAVLEVHFEDRVPEFNIRRKGETEWSVVDLPREFGTKFTRLLDELFDKADGRSLAEMLDIKSREVRLNTLGWIATLGSKAKDVADRIVPLLKESEPQVRLAAAAALFRAGAFGVQAEAVFVEALKASQGTVLLAALKSVEDWRVYSELIRNAAQELFAHKDARIRAAAAAAVGQMGPNGTAALPGLLGLSGDKDPSVRCAAIKSVVELSIDDKVTLEALKKGLADLHYDVRFQALKCLALQEKWLRSSTAEVRKAATMDPSAGRLALFAINLLARVAPDDPSIVALLEEVLERSEDQEQAAVLLGKLGTKARAALPALRRAAARETNEFARKRILKAIEQIEGR
jgi:HEAT repeat protein